MPTKIKIVTVVTLYAITLLFSCSTNVEESMSGESLELSTLGTILTETKNLDDSFQVETSLSSTDNKIPQNRDDLNKMRTVVKVFNGKNDAGISLPGFGGLKLGKDESSLNVYYLETKVVNNAADSVVYGYSIHYLFKKVERGVSVDNIPSVAASAQLNSQKTQVFYSLQTYGMKGNNLVKYFKPTINKSFNVEGFGIMQSSIDGIHNILGDPVLSKSVKFEPEILKFITPYELSQL